MVYKYRREILEGRDMSDVVRDELGDVIARLVAEHTESEIFEDWDLSGLEAQAGQLWPLSVRCALTTPPGPTATRSRGS